MGEHDLKTGPAKLGTPTLRSYTREEHEKIVLLTEQNKLTWEEACDAFEASRSSKTA